MAALIHSKEKLPEGSVVPLSRGQGRSSRSVGENGLASDSLRFRPMAVVATGTIIAMLYFARDVFIPLSMAILLSFLLAIPCSFLERHGFKRTLAVFIVVSTSFSLVVGAAWLLSAQFYDLARKLPGYHEVIESKLRSLKASPHDTVGQFNQMLRQTAQELQAPDTNQPPQGKGGQKSTALDGKPETKPVPVEVQQPQISSWGVLRGILTPVLKPLGTAFMVLVVLCFMLMGREDLRDRLIRLAGTDRMDLTTDALDEAANRVSRYLSMQSIVNCCFGILIGVGLSIIGVPSAALWGVLAMIFRFVPYVGVWISAVAPLALAFATAPGWARLAWTGGLFATAELVTSNFIEPLLYGSSTGVSPLALLLAAIFWTWLWGPIGLLLSTPLTVCLAVLGLHAPQLRFLHVLLGDAPVLTPETRFYQRLLAMDRDEADGIVEALLKEKPLPAIYEELMVPALTYAKEDLSHGRLTKEKEQFVFENIAEFVEELAEDEKDSAAQGETPAQASARQSEPAKFAVAVVPAKDKPDEIAGLMLRQLLGRRAVDVRALSATTLTADRLEDLANGQVNVICVSITPPTNLRRARYLCKKLRARFPAVKLVIGFWGGAQILAAVRESLSLCQPDIIAGTFAEAIAAIISLGSISSQPAPTETADLKMDIPADERQLEPMGHPK